MEEVNTDCKQLALNISFKMCKKLRNCFTTHTHAGPFFHEVNKLYFSSAKSICNDNVIVLTI